MLVNLLLGYIIMGLINTYLISDHLQTQFKIINEKLEEDGNKPESKLFHVVAYIIFTLIWPAVFISKPSKSKMEKFAKIHSKRHGIKKEK